MSSLSEEKHICLGNAPFGRTNMDRLVAIGKNECYKIARHGEGLGISRVSNGPVLVECWRCLVCLYHFFNGLRGLADRVPIILVHELFEVHAKHSFGQQRLKLQPACMLITAPKVGTTIRVSNMATVFAREL